MSKVITVTILDADIDGIAADNDIPEAEWVFARERVRLQASVIQQQVQALANELVENLVLFGVVNR